VVIATGFGSNLPAQVGLQGPKEIVYGVQAEVEMEGLKDVEIYLGQEVAPQAFAWVVPLFHSNGRLPSLARVGLITSKQAPRYFRSLLAHPAIRQRLRTPHPRMLVSPVPLVPMDCSVTDRVLVVGEAAGQVKTTTQGGIYYGMLCASLAAQTIVEAFQSGDFSATFLKRYHRAWTQAIGPELKTGLTLRRLFARFSDQQIEALIELGMREDVLGLVKRLAQFDWHRDLIRTSLQWPAMQQVIRGGLW
jgi:flavin-dependent dehydrogenase